MHRPALLTSAKPSPNGSASVGAPSTDRPPENGYVDSYLRGRAEFESRFGDLAKGKRNWQLIAYGAMGVLGISVAGNVVQGTQSHIEPYVVLVDDLGSKLALGPVEAMKRTDQRVVIRDITAFIRDIRTVLADPVAQAELVTRSYAFVDRNAAGFLNEYFADPDNDPRLLSADMTRLVNVTSVLPVPGAPEGRETWKVTWTETSIPRTAAGGLSTLTAWEGYLSTRIVPPRTADARIALNPLGIFVTSINWTQVASRRTSGIAAPPTAPAAAPAAVAPPASGRTP